MSKTYNMLDSMAVTVTVTPNAEGKLEGVIQDSEDNTSKIKAIAAYMGLPDKGTFPGTPITVGGSSKGGKSKKARRTKGGKSKKARKGKSLRRK